MDANSAAALAGGIEEVRLPWYVFWGCIYSAVCWRRASGRSVDQR